MTSKQDILHFPAPGLLPGEPVLAVHRRLGTLVCFSSSQQGHPRLIGEQQFSPLELAVLIPLLEAYPDYCPTEVLLAHWTSGGSVSEQTITRTRERLYVALEEGRWAQATRPVRGVISHVRLKLHQIGLDIGSIMQTGYLLRRAREKRPVQQQEGGSYDAPR